HQTARDQSAARDGAPDCGALSQTLAGGTLSQGTQKCRGLGPTPSDQGCRSCRALGGRGGDGVPAVAAAAGEANQTPQFLECLYPQAGVGLGMGHTPTAPDYPTRNPKGDPTAPSG